VLDIVLGSLVSPTPGRVRPTGSGVSGKGAREGPGKTQAQGQSVPRRCGEVKSKPRRSTA